MVSVIIPTYNREKTIGKAIESVLNQTYKKWELIIPDNCSTDNTVKIVQNYAIKDERIKLIQNQSNIGPVNNWKNGLKNCTGEYVKFLWSDDWLSENYLESLVPFMEKNKDVAFGFSKAIITDGNKILHIYKSYKTNGKKRALSFIKGELFHGERFPLSPGCAVFRKNVIDSNFIEVNIANSENLLFEKYGAGTDLLMFLNTLLVSKKCNKIYYTNNGESFYFSHKDSFSVENNLSSYYEHAKVHFLNKLKINRLTKLYFKTLKNSNQFFELKNLIYLKINDNEKNKSVSQLKILIKKILKFKK